MYCKRARSQPATDKGGPYFPVHWKSCYVEGGDCTNQCVMDVDCTLGDTGGLCTIATCAGTGRKDRAQVGWRHCQHHHHVECLTAWLHKGDYCLWLGLCRGGYRIVLTFNGLGVSEVFDGKHVNSCLQNGSLQFCQSRRIPSFTHILFFGTFIAKYKYNCKRCTKCIWQKRRTKCIK